MDTVKIGEFLARLRKEKNLTQAQLGEKIGVTNKTVSRWENGNYLPSVDMLKILSEEYGVTINEIINGERIANENYKEAADKNLSDALTSGSFTSKSSFTVIEKIVYWKKRWIKSHLIEIVFCVIIYCLLLTYEAIKGNIDVIIVTMAVGFVFSIFRYNSMMAYIERNAF